MRFVAVSRLKNFLYSLSDVQYEKLMEGIALFDPTQVDPSIKAKMLDDIDKLDDHAGIARAAAQSAFDSPEFLNMAKGLLTAHEIV